MPRRYRVACLTGCGTAPELMAEASRAIEAVSRLYGFRADLVHVSFGAGSLVRGGLRVPHAARTSYLDADAVLVADGDDEALAELCAELDLRARQTRVHFGRRSDVVLLSPVDDGAAAWTLERAFALAGRRRMRVAAVSDGPAWQQAVAETAARHEEVHVDVVERREALAAAAFDAERFDVLVADPTLGDALAALVGASSVSRRVAAGGFLAEHGPPLFGPLDAGSSSSAGFGVADPSSMLLAVAMLLGDGLGERGAAETLAGALAGVEVRTADRIRTGVAATTREVTDAVVAGFQLALPNAEFHPGALAR